MTDQEYTRLVADAPSISAKIRILYDAGMPKADIARFVNRRYQQIRNVLLDYEKKKAAASGDVSAPEEGAGEPVAAEIHQMVLGKGGSVRLPQAWLEAQGLGEGAAVICRIDGEGLRIMSREASIRELAALVKRRMPQEAALLETLLREP